MLRANDLSGFVARDLSGFKLSPQRGIKHESDRVATGDPEDERGWPRPFQQAYEGWHSGELTQTEAARLLGMCERSFRRYLARYEEFDLQGLIDKRIEQVSHRRAPVDEVMNLVSLYSTQYEGWNVRHFHGWYRREHEGSRSYTWVKNGLQAAGVVAKAPQRGAHRKRRERAAMAGMMIHQDGSTHEWAPDNFWDLIVTRTMPPASTTACSLSSKKARRAAFAGCARPLKATAYLPRCIPMALAVR